MFIMEFLAEHEKIIKQIFWIVLLCAFAIAFWKNVLLFVCAVSASVFTAEFISKELGVLIFVFYCLYVFFSFFKKHYYD